MFAGWRERRRILNAPFFDAWRAILRANVVHWHYLADDEREQAEAVVKELVARKQWSPARGFVITDEVKVTIAGQAALLALGFPGYDYPNVRTIVVHSTTIRVGGAHQGVMEGTQSEADLMLFGAAAPDGTVFLVWDELLA